MIRKGIPWKEVKKELLKDPETASAYAELEEEFAFIASMIRARREKGLSQEDLALRVGTSQGNISRLESGRHNPSLRFLRRVASALDQELKVSFQTRNPGMGKAKPVQCSKMKVTRDLKDQVRKQSTVNGERKGKNGSKLSGSKFKGKP